MKNQLPFSNWKGGPQHRSLPWSPLLISPGTIIDFLILGMFDYETDTYEVLLSTGAIGLFSDEMVKELSALKNLQDFALFTQNQTFETYRTAMSQYARIYPFTFRNNLIREGTVANEQIWNDFSLRDHATQFNALIIAKGEAYRLIDIIPNTGSG